MRIQLLPKRFSSTALFVFWAILFSGISAYGDVQPRVYIPEDHKRKVTAVAFSPDGRRVVSGGSKGDFSSPERENFTLKVWDVETGREIATVNGAGATHAVAVSPDNRFGLSGGADSLLAYGRGAEADCLLKLWDMETGKILRTFSGHRTPIRSVAFSRDGKYAVSGDSRGGVFLWDIETGRSIRSFPSESRKVSSVAFSIDGKRLFTGLSGSGGNRVIFEAWDVATGQKIRQLFSNIYEVYSASFSRDGKRVAALIEIEKTAWVWDVATGQVLFRLPSRDYDINHALLSPNGKHLLLGVKGGIEIWDVETGQTIFTYNLNSWEWVASSIFSAEGRYGLIGWNDARTLLLDLKEGKKVQSFGQPHVGVSEVDVSPEGRWAVSGLWDGTSRVWDIETGKSVALLGKPSSLFNKDRGGFNFGSSQIMAFSPDGNRLLTGGHGSTLRLWDTKTWRAVLTYSEHLSGVSALAFTPENRFALSGDSKGKINLWNVETGETLRSFAGNDEQVKEKHLDGYILYSSDGKVVDAKEALLSYIENMDIIFELAVSPDGKWAVSRNNRTGVQLWDIKAGEKIKNISWDVRIDGGPYMSSLIFTPDSKYLLFASASSWHLTHRQIIKWDLEKGSQALAFSEKPLGKYTSTVAQGSELALTQDGKTLVSADYKGTFKFWDMKSGALLKSYSIDIGHVNSFTITPDSRKILVQTPKGPVFILDAETGKELVRLYSFFNGGWAVMTPEGYYDADEKGERHINVRVNGKVYGMDKFRSRFHHPEKIQETLAASKK